MVVIFSENNPAFFPKTADQKIEIKKYKKIWTNLSTGKNWIGELRCKDKDGNDIKLKDRNVDKKDLAILVSFEVAIILGSLFFTMN